MTLSLLGWTLKNPGVNVNRRQKKTLSSAQPIFRPPCTVGEPAGMKGCTIQLVDWLQEVGLVCLNV